MTTKSAYDSIQAKAVDRINAELAKMDDAELLAIFRNANSYDGSFEWSEVFDIEDAIEYMDKYEIARAIIYGNVTNICEPVRFNAYANLENVSIWQLYDQARNCSIDLAWWLLYDAASIDVDLCSYEGQHICKISERWNSATKETIEAVAAMMK